jgi:hypothetical protein
VVAPIVDRQLVRHRTNNCGSARLTTPRHPGMSIALPRACGSISKCDPNEIPDVLTRTNRPALRAPAPSPVGDILSTNFQRSCATPGRPEVAGVPV